MDKSTLHGLSLVLTASATLTLPWLFATLIGRRRGFYAARPKTRATANRALAHFGRWEALEAATVHGEDGVARVQLPPRAEREN